MSNAVQLLAILSGLSLVLTHARADDRSKETRSISTIINDHHAAVQQHREKLRAASRQEREQLAVERPSVFDTARSLSAAIEAKPDDPAVIDAAGWILNSAPEKEVLDVLIPVLIKHHTRSDELAQFCFLAAREAGDAFAGLMESISRDNPHPPVKGAAMFALGCIYRDSNDPARRAKAEEVFAAVVEKFKEVKFGDTTLAQTADDALFKLRHLRVGKQAPEIEGEDADGNKFKLSDHRGKAVVVGFFGFW